MNEAKGTALITGASSGIGTLYADRLARQGYDLILVARNATKLERVAQAIRKATGRQIDTLPADLANPAELLLVEARLANERSITLLVNNAGIGSTARALDADVDTMSAMVSLNVEALMRLTYAVVPAFVARGRGTIVNIASIVAVAPEVLNGVYGGSKAFVLAFSQNLRHELDGTGVGVQVVLPGATATDFWDIAGTPVEHLPGEIVMRADQLVDAALTGLARGEFATIPSLHDESRWAAFEAARQAMAGELSTSTPAARYLAA
ncbi:SDR family NAD(P)-dependent oxidoreductase [Sphingopyxis sp. RIFCSPHIGHO2_12_FULL_65_19]|uniref:SDR family NAD(P)-dependent oxidoreductase n=1 Tax=Sphingopyxis sp. RIFCSPHIGHO2_12_FULL_65_19 TaxID=1802172 RepID=UPI0008BCDE4E|nr:SDR family oxidoreductase [Sphingopyxis sp. RIFCSPHIGHO2_12_FULL_65_19]OHD06257.1 MAG: short-chain dehydrogenase [Sphingopyxis sp. RIFCSPHIGHO2_12_FULL_65_19]